MNLIANDLVLVHPMSSMSGYVNYIQYEFGIDKGTAKAGEMISSPFGFGQAHPDYSGSAVIDSFTTFTSGTSKVSFFPVIAGSIRALDADGNEVSDNATTAWTAGEDGTITAGAYVGGKSATDVKKIAYKYDNIIIPQESALPTIKAEMKSVALVAKARRIAVYFSQIAAYQAKTDYGMDLGDQLAEKAVGELSYEIDTEVIDLLNKNATYDATLAWSKTLPVGVSKKEHYEGFSATIEEAKRLIYGQTRKFMPNYMVCDSSILPVLTMISAFKSAPMDNVNGPFFAGTLNGIKVFVSPAMTDGEFFLGVNGNDGMSSAAVYAPYMAIVPTQLLQYADGGTSQGLNNCYNYKIA